MIDLRAATLADCERVYEWNFAPEVRARSRTPSRVSPDSHARWFAARLAQPAMWIVLDEAQPVGVIRIDADANLSIVLDATARGRGTGKAAIRAACSRWGKAVTAVIHTLNRASRACFEACAFVPVSHDGNLVTYRWSP